jgi:hypothetical protein
MGIEEACSQALSGLGSSAVIVVVGRLPTATGREQANIRVDRATRARWTFVQSHTTNIQMKSGG